MKVDIIIPAYNPGTHIIDAIDSCLNQTHKNFQIIVIDDCSKENLSYLEKKYPKIKLLKTEKNSGPAAARNLGIKNGSSELVSFLDSDDIMHQDKLAYSVEEFKKSKSLGMTCGNYQIIVNRKKLMNQFYRKSPIINWNTLMKQNLVASGSVTISRNVLEEMNGFNEKYCIAEDYDLWLRVSEKYPIKYISRVLYYYSVSPGNNSLTQRQDIQKNHSKNLELIKSESLSRINKLKE